MKINRRLNLAVRVEREDETELHVHHVPVSEEVFQQNWRLLTKAIVMCYGDVFSPAVAARVGYRMICEVAESMKLDQLALESRFFGHVWRLTTVIFPDKSEPVPFDVAVTNGMLDSDELNEIRNAICFFTSASWVHPRGELKMVYAMMEGEKKDSAFVTGSWSCTEYAASLRTSKPPVSSGATTPVLSVPH